MNCFWKGVDSILQTKDSEKQKLLGGAHKLEPLWTAELQTHGPNKCSVTRLWLKFIWCRLLVVIIGLCFNAVVTFLMTGYITDVISHYLEDGPETSIRYAVVLVLAVALGQMLRCASYTFLRTYGTQTGIRFRSGMLGIVYKKLLKLKDMNGKIASEIVTIFASDSLRVFMNTQLLIYILSMPIYLIIGISYTYYLIGVWCFVALGTFAIFFIIQTVLIEIMSILRHQTLRWTDRRIRKMTEVLTSIKLIKMYAWEETFRTSIMDIRSQETKPLIWSSILNLIFNAIMPITPSIASVVTIALYVHAGNDLTVSKGFSVVATLGFIRNGLFYAPYAARVFGEAIISFQRIRSFLLKEEFELPTKNVENIGNAIELRNTVFMWESNSTFGDNSCTANNTKETIDDSPISTIILRHDNIDIKKGNHIGVCGTVGCGKSSFLQALIGRMPLMSGHFAVNGSVAYTAQQAWIFNGTLRENILFGQPYKQEWYTKVLHACNLGPDLRTLPNSDRTEIGDRGANLSGGQKQRVSLARAVYSDSDIYLLDDPLSAVDGHVGRHLFHECINTLLKDKTVVLVTHQLQYLEHCDEVFVMDAGELVQHGTHEALMTTKGHYQSLMKQFSSNKDTKGVMDGKNVDREFAVNCIPTSQDSTSSYADKYTKGVLTDRETSKVGDISFAAYMSYIRASGGTIVCSCVLLLYICALSAVAFTEWWFGLWIKRMNAPVLDSFPSNDTTVAIKNIAFPGQSYNVTTSPRMLKEEEETNWYLSIYIYSTLGILGLAVLKGVVAGSVLTKAAVTLHSNVVGRIMGVPMQFFDANPPGRIINRFSRDIEEADIFIPHQLDMVLQGIIMFVISLITMAFNFPLFLIAVVPITCYFYTIKTIASVPIRNFKRLENVVRSPLIGHVTTTCNGLSTVVSCSQQSLFMQGCQQHSDMTSVGMFLFDSSMRWMSFWMDVGGSLLAIISTIIVVSTKGAVSPALAVLSLTMCINTTSLIQFFTRSINEVEGRFTSIERIHEYENLEIEKDAGDLQTDTEWPNQGMIVFSNVEMKYRIDMDPVLKNISFYVFPGQKVGIVGRTGAGKSSLATALFRLADLSRGQVLIDDIDITRIPRKWLRSKLSLIPQDPVLFAGTLRYNLDPFKKHTDEEVWKTIEQVHLKEKMKPLDLTLDLNIEENGENFSVGERQLICLARAILRQNKILVLDEATASIDTTTDALIQETVKASFSSCTVLTIAHRLNTVLHCDVILVMEAGRVIEMGNPQTLLKNPSSYFNDMIRAQTTQSHDI